MVKRLVDITIALLGLFALSPVLLGLSILVRLKLGSPIFFLQQRPGRHGKPFGLIKFRTMADIRDSVGNLLQDSERLSRFGKILRDSSLDELPELVNVLRGDMSLVGPRPLLMRYLERYTRLQMRRHEIKPGITGWAQVNGRNALTWEQKFAYDIWYVDNRSLMLDLKILALTILKILRREGVNPPGHETMEEFFGSNGK